MCSEFPYKFIIQGVSMDKTKIEYFKEYISQLPPGNITYKTINGKRYPYYQWTDKETGKQRNRWAV